MSKRRILYGYVIQDGELTVVPEEAKVVRQIFKAYLAGSSYQGITDKLNVEQIPYSVEKPQWDKHKIKRMLENCHYIGKSEYPPIISPETFELVQQLIQSKTTHYIHQKRNIQPIIHTELTPPIYAPSVEVWKTDNSINRALEQTDNPLKIMELILKGITARYVCCKIRR